MTDEQRGIVEQESGEIRVEPKRRQRELAGAQLEQLSGETREKVVVGLKEILEKRKRAAKPTLVVSQLSEYCEAAGITFSKGELAERLRRGEFVGDSVVWDEAAKQYSLAGEKSASATKKVVEELVPEPMSADALPGQVKVEARPERRSIGRDELQELMLDNLDSAKFGKTAEELTTEMAEFLKGYITNFDESKLYEQLRDGGLTSSQNQWLVWDDASARYFDLNNYRALKKFNEKWLDQNYGPVRRLPRDEDNEIILSRGEFGGADKKAAREAQAKRERERQRYAAEQRAFQEAALDKRKKSTKQQPRFTRGAPKNVNVSAQEVRQQRRERPSPEDRLKELNAIPVNERVLDDDIEYLRILNIIAGQQYNSLVDLTRTNENRADLFMFGIEQAERLVKAMGEVYDRRNNETKEGIDAAAAAALRNGIFTEVLYKLRWMRDQAAELLSRGGLSDDLKKKLEEKYNVLDFVGKGYKERFAKVFTKDQAEKAKSAAKSSASSVFGVTQVGAAEPVIFAPPMAAEIVEAPLTTENARERLRRAAVTAKDMLGNPKTLSTVDLLDQLAKIVAAAAMLPESYPDAVLKPLRTAAKVMEKTGKPPSGPGAQVLNNSLDVVLAAQ